MSPELFNSPAGRLAYISTMRPLLNRKALFADTTERFVSPAEPNPGDTVTIRFRTWKHNADSVYLIIGDSRIRMHCAYVRDDFEYYETAIVATDEIISYHFEIVLGRIRGYFDARGFGEEVNPYYDLRVIPGFHTPVWAKGAVMYQIYVDRFCNGDSSNDVQTGEYCYINEQVCKVDQWDRYPAAMDVREFYGGDLAGVISKLDYLKSLGVEAIYFNPLFVSPSNHKYDTQDYDHIDPHIGVIVDDRGELLAPGVKDNTQATRYMNRVTNIHNLEASDEIFIKLVNEAHARGIKVIIDGVFNHCGSYNRFMDRERIYETSGSADTGAYKSADSRYCEYFKFRDPNGWPDNKSYEGWWGHDTLPKLNYENSERLVEYVLDIARKWVSPPYNADGWRLDVAADLAHSIDYNHQFWKRFRNAVKSANPEAAIWAEHYGNTREWLQGDEWDSVMNYDAFMEPITWFLTGMEKHSDDYRADMLGNAESFWGSMLHNTASLTTPSLQMAMNQLSNHDHSRFMTRTSHKVGRTSTLGPEAANTGNNPAVYREAVVMQMTWPGSPTLYYGDEAGLCGFTDPDNRRTYPWGREDQDLIAFHTAIINIHKTCGEFRTGSLHNLDAGSNYLAYARFDRAGQSVILINNGDSIRDVHVKVCNADIPRECLMHRIFLTDTTGYDTNPDDIAVVNGYIHLVLPSYSAMILRHEKPQ